MKGLTTEQDHKLLALHDALNDGQIQWSDFTGYINRLLTEAGGYRFKNDGACKSCRAVIEWWETPNGKMMPLDKATLEPHWATCPQADQFRKGRP